MDEVADLDAWRRKSLHADISERLAALPGNLAELTEALGLFFPDGNVSGAAIRRTAINGSKVSSKMYARGIVDTFRGIADDIVEVAKLTAMHTGWDQGMNLSGPAALGKLAANKVIDGQTATALTAVYGARNTLGHQRHDLIAEKPANLENLPKKEKLRWEKRRKIQTDLDTALETVAAAAASFIEGYDQWVKLNITPEPPRPALEPIEPDPVQDIRRVVIDNGPRQAAAQQTPFGRERRTAAGGR